MAMIFTTLGFFLLTGLLVWLHVRRTATAQPAASKATGPPCVRCRFTLPPNATFCPGCGLPLQIFEVVRAPEQAVRTEAVSGARPHAVVRADLCVGCKSCLAACPEEGALTIEGSLARVDLSLCVGHGQCVPACPVGGIVLSLGGAVHSVEVPWLDAQFQTNLAGVHIVGELGGRGLIKNAVNEGKLAVESIARELACGHGEPARLEECFDLIIVGSGPAGLSAGLEAHRSGLRYQILEQGSLGDSIRRYPRHKLLLAEPVHIPLYGDLWVADATKESLLQVWETIAANTGLRVHTGAKVTNILRREGVLIVETASGVSYLTRRVVLAMGRRGSPRRLGVPGEEQSRVVYDVSEMEVFRGRRVLVVGGGESAAETALGLSRQEDTEVTLCHRGAGFQRVGARNLAKLDQAIQSDRVRACFETQVREIGDHDVRIESNRGSEVLPNDDVIVRIGGELPSLFLDRIGVRMVKKELALSSGEGERAEA